MAVLHCDKPCVPCNDPADPISNFSSEQPDRDDFISLTPGFFGGTHGGGHVHPPLGTNWTSESCGGTCISDVSQEEADLCADRLAVDCLPDVFPPTDPTDPRRRTYPNEAQTCAFLCPDGSPYSFTAEAGLFRALDPVTAHRIAYSFACKQALKRRLCLGVLNPDEACLGILYSGEVDLTGPGAPFTVEVVAGALPPGLFESGDPTTWLLSGVPSAGGDYAFTLRAVSHDGLSHADKSFTLPVVGITTTSLPNGAPGQPYSQALSATSNAQNPVWSIAAGALPTGLTLNAHTGVISGTVDALAPEQSYLFTVRMCDDHPICCTRPMTLTVVSAALIDWSGFNGLAKSHSDGASGSWSFTSTATPPSPTTETVTITGSAVSSSVFPFFAPGEGPGQSPFDQSFAAFAIVKQTMDVKVHYKLTGSYSGAPALTTSPFLDACMGGTILDCDLSTLNADPFNSFEPPPGAFVTEGDFTMLATPGQEVTFNILTQEEGIGDGMMLPDPSTTSNWTLVLTITPL